MRVIFISHVDYANFSYEKSESLKLMGVDCDSFVLKPHPFGYPKQSIQCDVERMKSEIDKADLIHVMHSCGTCWDLVKHTGKRIIVWHTGTRYRSEPEKHNERWNPIVERSIFALGEFEKLGCKNGEYFSVTIDENSLSLQPCTSNSVRFGHFPSNPQVKGTQRITSVLSELARSHKGRFTQNISVKRVIFNMQKRRMADCNVYIEMCTSTQMTSTGQKEYGSFGTTALESAMMGKVVLTNFLWNDIYKKTYGDHKLLICNDRYELKNTCINLIEKNIDEINQMGVDTRAWAIEKHGRKATGERLMKYL